MGEWVQIEVGYLRPNRLSCDLCGQPLAGRHWTAEVEGERRSFCDPKHKETFGTYWLPRYGVEPAGEQR